MRARTGQTALWRIARTLGSRQARGKLPPLFFVTDPARTPDPAAVAARLPRGAGIIYRAFGRTDADTVGRALARTAAQRALILLVGADEALARRIGAAGVHLPERDLHRARALKRTGLIVTGAAHSARALARAGRAGVDAALLSTVFPSNSPSAGRPLGPVRFAALVRRARTPVYALGGVTAKTAKRLKGSGAAGLAAVDGVHEGRGGA